LGEEGSWRDASNVLIGELFQRAMLFDGMQRVGHIGGGEISSFEAGIVIGNLHGSDFFSPSFL
jgi:hypothetical protein